jgi:predicted Zn-dependent protease
LYRFPDFAPAQKHLAPLYQLTIAKRDEAYDLPLKARETLPNGSELAQLLAKLSYQRNEFAYAVQLLQQSATRGTLDAEGLYYLGMSHLNEKNTLQARAGLDQALAAASTILSHLMPAGPSTRSIKRIEMACRRLDYDS